MTAYISEAKLNVRPELFPELPGPEISLHYGTKR